MAGSPATFEPPGPGQWLLDRSHFPGATTAISQWLMTDAMQAGMRRSFAENGVPADTISCRFVNGFMYTRLIPIVGGDKPPRPLPPNFVLKIATRLHPRFRARRRAARAALTERRFVDAVRDWEASIRPKLVEKNQAFQRVDLASLTDADLERHLDRLLDHVHENSELHFILHGHDLGPVARYLHHCIGWGLDPTEALSALAGASPSTAAHVDRLNELRNLIEAADADVTTPDEIRAVSPAAAALLDEHLDELGSTLVTGYDITAFTLSELPGVLVGSITSARPIAEANVADVIAELRSQVPAPSRETFDEYLNDARLVMDMRDDNGPKTIEAPYGLLRLALLEVGRRLTERGTLNEPEHALDLTPTEARTVFSSAIPDGATLQQRALDRIANLALDPPATLGPDEPQPPIDVLPEPLGDMVATVQTAVQHLGMDGTTNADPFTGVGIGTATYRGRVRTAESADEAIEKLEPGDVLVVRATSPAFNAMLAVAGAVITANGGALSHAAVLARELGIPAVVGASGALQLADGSVVEVDPIAGRVTPVA